MKLFKSVFVAVCCTTIFSIGCTTHGDYSSQINTLDSLKFEIEKLEPAFAAIDMKFVKQTSDTVTAHLDCLKENFNETADLELSTLFSKYRTITKLLPDFGKKYNDVTNEINHTKIQLHNLKEALSKNASHDSKGNKMSLHYVQENVATEKKAAENLIVEMRLLIERPAVMRERYDSLAPLVRQYLDSIPPKSQP